MIIFVMQLSRRGWKPGRKTLRVLFNSTLVRECGFRVFSVPIRFPAAPLPYKGFFMPKNELTIFVLASSSFKRAVF